MNQKQKNRWLKSIVVFCLGFCATFCIATFVSLWFGVDGTDVLRIVVALFGGELLMSCVIKLVADKKNDNKNDKEDNGNG